MTRFHSIRRSLTAAVLGFGVFLAGAAWLMAPRNPAGAADSSAIPLPGRVARLLASQLPERHLTRRPMDEALAADAMDLFLSAVDFERSIFLQSDIDGFRTKIPDLITMLHAGDISFPLQVFETFKERLADRVAFAEKTLKTGFNFERTDTYVWRRKNLPWPASAEERDELWRRKLQHETLARILAVKLTAEEAEKKTRTEAGNSTDTSGKSKEPAAVSPAPDALQDAGLSPEDFVLKRHRQYYLVMKDSDDEWILDHFFSSFTRSYDPHSDYLSPEKSEDFDINMRLSLFGVGAMLTTEDGAAKIDRVIPGGPMARDGRIQANDRIVAIAQGDEPAVDILHWPLYRIVRLIRGEKGTRVTLTIWPASDISGAVERRIDLVRDEVKLEERAATGEVRDVPGKDGTTNQIGILKLPEFYADFKGQQTNGDEARRCSRDVRRILEDFHRQGVQGVVFDMRDNGGGSLPDAIEIAGLFIKSGPIVQIRDEQRVQVATDPDSDVVYEGPLVVLINRMSASASEIVAAALQDYRRAVIVGDRQTHGKGTVQTLLPLVRGDDRMGQLKITTAAFYRIAGGSTQLKGVEADIPVPSVLDELEAGEISLPHALPWTQVDPSFYAVFQHAIPPISELRSRSEARRTQNPEFIQRDSLIDRIGQRMKSDTISLNLEERIQQARTERDLEQLQRTLIEQAEPTEKQEPSRDLLLQESVAILEDMIALQIEKKTEQAAILTP